MAVTLGNTDYFLFVSDPLITALAYSDMSLRK